MQNLELLISEYRKGPEIFQAGRYWRAYEDRIISKIKEADLEELRSGKYTIFGTFGFTETVYNYPIGQPLLKRIALRIIRKFFISNKSTLPYSLNINDLREMAYNYCLAQGEIAGLKSISEIEVCTFGKPDDLFMIKGKYYTMAFLSSYIRLCYAQKFLLLTGNETIVELGSGSGHQVEVLKKVFPDLTILCFDLPYTLYLGHQYLKQALDNENVVDPATCLKITNLDKIEEKKVYMFGNWLFPLLKNINFDVFWNAASFGEMEPNIVENYLSYILEGCRSIYLLQARHGKESSDKRGVENPITFEDYKTMLKGYKLVDESDAYQAHRRLSQSGGYFQAVWKIDSKV